MACTGRPADGSAALDADGQALAPDQPIAVARVALLTADEGWLEGIRVDPRVRGLGVATDLQTAELHWLAAHRVRVVRYATGARNEASHRLGGRHGFELLTRYRTWAWRDRALPADDVGHSTVHGFDEAARSDASRRRRELLTRLRTAKHTIGSPEAGRWWRRVLADPGFAAAGRLYERRAWAMQELDERLFLDHVAAGEVVASEDGSGWALAIVTDEALPAEDVSIHLALLVGEGASMTGLADTIRQLADESIRLRLPLGDGLPGERVAEAFAALGFSARPWELHILARRIAGSLPAVESARLILSDPPRRVIRP